MQLKPQSYGILYIQNLIKTPVGTLMPTCTLYTYLYSPPPREKSCMNPEQYIFGCFLLKGDASLLWDEPEQVA